MQSIACLIACTLVLYEELLTAFPGPSVYGLWSCLRLYFFYSSIRIRAVFLKLLPNTSLLYGGEFWIVEHNKWQ